MPPVQHPTPGSRSFFAVGGPAFNGLLLVVLFGLMAFVVGSPTRDSLEQARSPRDGAAAPDGRADGSAVTRGGRAAPATAGRSVTLAADADDAVAGEGSGEAGGGTDGGAGTTTTGARPAAYTASYGAWSGDATSGAVRTAGQQAPRIGTTSTGAVRPSTSSPAPKSPAPKSSAPKTAVPKPVSSPPAAKPRRVTCDDFATQPPAQAAFDRDPTGLAHLDGDADGRACEHLPGTPPEGQAPSPAPTPPPVLTVAAVANPATKFYGVHTKDAPWWMGEVDHIARLTGKAPNLNLFFTNFGERFPAAAVDASWNRGMTPVVTWEPIVPGSTVGQPRLRDLYEGRLDTYVDQWAAEAAANGKPMVLRFAHEMNGSWYPWSQGVNGNVAGDYAKAWRHVHERFEAAGADNVLWMWSVNRVDWLKTRIADYYPGDEFVDWVGLSGYYRSSTQSAAPTFEATFGATLDALRATAPGKKVFLSEIAAGTDDRARVQWIRSAFDGMSSRPEIIGFAWFNDVKTDGDWRIQFSQATVDAFAAGVASDRWGGGVLPAGMTPGSRMTVPSSPGGSSPTGAVDKG